MIRTLLGAFTGLLLVGCGVEDSTIIVRQADEQAERFAGATEEGLLRASGTYDAVFEAAGHEFNVPPALLKSLSYSLTRYEMVQGEGEFEGQSPGFGLMAVRAELLAEAGVLAQVSEAQARTDVTANVRVAAAWLSKRADAAGIDRDQLLAWSTVIGEYSGVEDPTARSAFLRGEVYAALKLGVGRLSDQLEREGLLEPLEAQVGEHAEVSQGLSRAPDYGAAVWRPSPNSSSRSGSRPQLVVIHTCEGAYSGCWGWLGNSRAQASAHYVVDSTGSEVSQLVREADKAWHVAANYDCGRNGGVMCGHNGQGTNGISIGIEHAGYASQSSWSAGQLDASARLVCNITKDWGIARDRYHIVGHGQLQPWNRTDPGRNWPWASYLQKVNAACGSGGGGSTPAPTPTPAPAPAPTGGLVIDSNNANNNQARGYIQVSANWKSSTNVVGYYGTGYWYAATAEVSDGAAFFFKLDADEAKTIDAWWAAATDRSAAATFVAFNSRGERIGTGTVNQTGNGGKWNTVGRFNFTAGWNKVVLSRWQSPGKVVIADAVRIR